MKTRKHRKPSMPTQRDHARFHRYLSGEAELAAINNAPLSMEDVHSLLDDPNNQQDRSFLGSAMRGASHHGGAWSC